MVSVKNCLRSQGFKSDYKLSGSPASQLNQIRRAFPPPIAKRLGVSLLEHLEEVNRNLTPTGSEKGNGVGNKRMADEELEHDHYKKFKESH